MMDFTERMVLLRSLPFFGGLPESRLTRLAAGAVVTTLGPGETIATRDQSGDAFYLLASGQAKLYQIGADGREQTLYVLGPGEPFCLCLLVEGGDFPAFAAALTEVRLLVFPAASLSRAAKEEPEVLFDLLRLMCHRLKEAMAMIESLALRDLPGRVAGFVLNEAARSLAGDVVHLGISHRELAKIVGATPEALSRAFKRLGEAGLLTVRGRDIVVHDRAGLAREAGIVPVPDGTAA